MFWSDTNKINTGITVFIFMDLQSDFLPLVPFCSARFYWLIANTRSLQTYNFVKKIIGPTISAIFVKF